jgi:hypothetical protein
MAEAIAHNELADQWKKAITIERDDEGQALVARRRMRIHLGQLLSAAWKTAMAAVDAHELVAGNPLATIRVGAEAFGAMVATLKAVQQPMPAADFLACMTLSNLPNGLTPQELADEIQFRCTQVPPDLFPWYLGIDAPYLERALRGIQSPNTIESLVSGLRARGLARDGDDGRIVFVDQDIVWQVQ